MKMGRRKKEVEVIPADKQLDSVISVIEKQFGKGSIMKFNGEPREAWPTISTGSMGLDIALGIGGLPLGRLVEIYGSESAGKTTLALHAVAEAQKQGLVCAYVDAEHALDPSYAEALGVNLDKMLLSQPDNGEQALEIVDTLISSGAVKLAIVDSVAALVPKAELEGDMGDTHMGLQARLMSQAMRKLAGNVARSNAIVIFINQTRMKIGVMFGCFQYDARVCLADGGAERIGKIVNQKMPVEVLAVNKSTGWTEPKKVVGWHDNGKAEVFLHVVTESVGGSGRTGFVATPNHHVLVWDGSEWGELEVGELEPGCLLGHRALIQFNSVQRQLALGSVLGDGSIRHAGRHQTQMRFGHGKDQIEYARWKQSLMEGCVSWCGSNSAGGWSFDCRPSVDLNYIFKQAYPYKDGSLRELSDIVLNELNRFGVAIWCMDDGSFSGSYTQWGNGKFEIAVKRYTLDECHRLANMLERLDCGKPTVTDRRTLLWSGERTKKLHSRIAEFIPPCMQHKLHPDFRGKYGIPYDVPQKDGYVMVPVPVVDVYEQPLTSPMQRFDLTIEDNHTYLVGGLGVHNSPVTTTGGNALKFYASIRLNISRIGSVKMGEKNLGNRTRVKIAKNKFAPPFKEVEFDLVFGKGISKIGELMEYGVEHDVIQQNGAWFSIDGERIAQGRQNTISIIENDKEMADKILEAVMEKINNAETT